MSGRKQLFQKDHLPCPSRVWRNICAEAGAILKASYERMILTEKFLENKELIDASAERAARRLKANRFFVENIQKQIRNFRERYGRLPRNFFDLGIPEYRGLSFTTQADDSIEEGKFKKLKIDPETLRYTLSIKLPVSLEKWKWFEIEQNLPGKVAELLRKGAKLKAPDLVKRKRKCGKVYYTIKFVLEAEVEDTEQKGKIFSVDLSPSVKRLGAGVFFDGSFHSRPVYFSAERLIRKTLRLQKEIDRLEHKIDEAYRRRDFSRIKHLFGEQKRRRRKLKAIRKQILEIFTNELILLAKENCCSTIAIENLSGIRIPDWKSKVLRYLFSGWFYGKVKERLRQKALRNGIKLVLVNPKNTSRRCHICGSELSGRGLYLKCEKCGKIWDRDYNASVNIAKKAFISRGKPEGLDSEGVRQREPLRLTPRLHVEVKDLLEWLRVVKISVSAHLIRNKKLEIGKR